MKKRISISVFLLLATLVWCASAFTEQPPAPRGELRIVDKRRTNRWSIEAITIEALIGINEDGTLRPQLASGWRWLDDRTLEITLRKGVRFHNGEPLDAEIVKRNFEIRQELRVSYGGVFLGGFAQGMKVEIIDPLKLRLVLPEPDATALKQIGAMSIANRQFFRTLAQKAKEENKPLPVRYYRTLRGPGSWGTGPYRVVEGDTLIVGKTSDKVVLEANRAYWDTEPFARPQRITFNHRLTQDKAVELVELFPNKFSRGTDHVSGKNQSILYEN